MAHPINKLFTTRREEKRREEKRRSKDFIMTAIDFTNASGSIHLRLIIGCPTGY
jgi:hypothetical protein